MTRSGRSTGSTLETGAATKCWYGVRRPSQRPQRCASACRSADVADKYLSRIEVGAVTLLALVAYRIARALGATLDDLLGAEPTPSSDPRWRAILRALRCIEEKGELERVSTILSTLAR